MTMTSTSILQRLPPTRLCDYFILQMLLNVSGDAHIVFTLIFHYVSTRRSMFWSNCYNKKNNNWLKVLHASMVIGPFPFWLQVATTKEVWTLKLRNFIMSRIIAHRSCMIGIGDEWWAVTLACTRLILVSTYGNGQEKPISSYVV